jgi:hypothetical protein
MHDPLPKSAAWRHLDSREGFETTFFASHGPDTTIEGHTAAVEDAAAWAVRYAITVDGTWHAREATIVGQVADGVREVLLRSTGEGRWEVNGRRRPELDGCLDVDLESSACTNTLPVHRLGLDIGDRARAPAAYVRASDLAVTRLEQEYRRIDNDGQMHRYWYSAPAFDFECELVFDASGLTFAYPGIACRVL